MNHGVPRIRNLRVAWVAQLVKCSTLDFGSGHDLRVVRLSPGLGSLSLCPSSSLLSLSLSHFLEKEKEIPLKLEVHIIENIIF